MWEWGMGNGEWGMGNGGIWEYGNMGIWEYGNMGIWEYGNMGMGMGNGEWGMGNRTVICLTPSRSRLPERAGFNETKVDPSHGNVYRRLVAACAGDGWGNIPSGELASAGNGTPPARC